MISVLILTKNEEHDLAACLDSVAWSDDVHVFDSFSSDRSVEIARSRGAQLTQRSFDNYASHRNAALRGLRFRYPWVLSVDADERIPEELTEEMREFVKTAPSDVAACRIRRRDFFMGRWLRHAAISPYYLRLVRPERVHYERAINEVLKVDGGIHEMRASFNHFPFSKGVRHWIDKHNLYSSMEAEEVVKSRAGRVEFSVRKAIFSRDFHERRFHQKGIVYQLPFRPLLKFCYMMFLRRAFMDGQPGTAYAFLQSIYEYFIVLKTRELTVRETTFDSPRRKKFRQVAE